MDIFGNFSQLMSDRRKREVSRKEELDYIYTDVTLEGISKIEDRTHSSSYFGIKILVVIFFCLLVGRLFYLQVASGNSYRQLAEDNRIQPRILEAGRGLITDSNGLWLARNKPNFVLALYPSDLPRDKQSRAAVYDQIAALVNKNRDEIQASAEKNGLFSLNYIALQENIPHDDALILQKKIYNIPGLSVVNKSSREYVSIPGMSHILGYTGKVTEAELAADAAKQYTMTDRLGKTGLELQYESTLKGQDGVEEIEVNSKGNIVRVLVAEGKREPVSGNNIVLYLDTALQQKTADALKTGMENAKVLTGDTSISSGTAIVMDVNNGGILAMVSLPDYNNNLFADGISSQDYQAILNDSTKPMFNRAIAGAYPPGSVSKIILASAGLSEGNINKNTAFVTPVAIQIGDYSFPDWKDHSYESTNVKTAIAESNNVFFYSIGGGFDKIKGLGINLIKKWWKIFGLGAKTGIDLPGEASGLLPDGAWKQKLRGEPWYIGDTYHVSIGQGDLLVTPIQMLRATVAIANGGKLLQPQIIKKITDSTGKIVQESEPIVQNKNVASADVIKTVQEGMRQAVTSGSARNMGDLPVSVAGKTGTAQFLDNQKTHAWFECYAPYENPQIAVIVLIDGGGGGHEIAAPVAHEILQYYFTR